MKKILILLFAFVSLLGLNSCASDDDVIFIAQPDSEGINFVNSFNDTYVLTSATSSNIAERFVWNTVDFDVPTNITYELQASADADFTSFDVLGSTTDNNLGIKVSQLMTLATDAGLDNDAETEAPNTGQIYFRVKAFAGNDGGNALNTSSEIKSITVVMPEAAVEEAPSYKEIYLIGDATAAGWNNNNNNTPLFRDATNENIYYYTGKFNVGFFKFIEMKGAWAPMYGIADGSTLQYRETEDDADPGSIEVTTEGYYTITLNIEDLTYSFTAYDASAAATYDVIGIVGDGTAVGWPNDDNPTPDIKMSNSDFDKHIWQANDVVLTDGPAKFRANLAWDVNWGGGENFPSGIATGDDIMVQAGTYTVWFNDITGRYTFIPVVTE